MGSFAAAASFGTTGSVFGVHVGESRIIDHESAATATRAAATRAVVGPEPNHTTMRGVKNDESAVPPMPAPKTPVAKPRRGLSYHAFTNGMPTANVVPAMPRKNPNTSSIG